MSIAVPPAIIEQARRLYFDRRRREEFFPHSNMFGEPAWDILLDLFVATGEGRVVSVSSACIGAAVPATTALRWLRQLERDGLIERHADNHDRRRSNLRVTQRAVTALRGYLTHSADH